MFYKVEPLFGVLHGLTGFREEKFLDSGVLHVKMSVRCLNSLLSSTVLELNFRARSSACYMSMRVGLIHCIARARLVASPRK